MDFRVNLFCVSIQEMCQNKPQKPFLLVLSGMVLRSVVNSLSFSANPLMIIKLSDLNEC